MVLKLEMNDDVPPLDRPFDIDFKGGSLADLKAVLEETLPDLNIIEGYSVDDMNTVQVPAVNLKGVNCHQFADLLNEIEYDNTRFYFPEPETNILLLSGEVYREPVSQPKPAPKPKTELLAYHLDNLLGSYSMEDIILALDQAYMVMNLDIPEYRFHKETSMLMVAVTPKQLEIAHKILISLEDSVAKERPKEELKKAQEELNDSTNKIHSLMEELQEMQSIIQRQQIELDVTKDALNKASEK